MRNLYFAIVVAIGFGLVSCNRDAPPRREEPAARQLGRDAHEASQEIKRDAKKAGQEIRKAGKDFREGWDEGKHDDPARRKK
jgi:hypothetical protein